MSTEDSFAEVFGRLQSGDEAAATELFKRFAPQLLSKARSKLNRHLRQKVDEDDIVQSVFETFFRRHADGQFEKYDLQSWDSLWGLLITITLRKCHRQSERFGKATGRDAGKEQSLTPASDSVMGWQAVDGDPSPSQAVVLSEQADVLAETVEQVLSALPEKQRELVALVLAGHKVREISTLVNRSLRTVERQLSEAKLQLRERYELLQDDGGDVSRGP